MGGGEGRCLEVGEGPWVGAAVVVVGAVVVGVVVYLLLVR